MLLVACLNGARLPGEHPRLPATAADLARDAAAAVAAGAHAVHVHPKDGGGRDTLDAAVVDEVVAAVREALPPGVPVGVTTGAWAVPEPGDRGAAVAAWSVLPDSASVNWHEPGADDVAGALLGRGVEVEAGIWHAEGLEAWLASPHRERCGRVLVELPDGLAGEDVAGEADRLLARIGAAAADAFRAGAVTRTRGGAGDGAGTAEAAVPVPMPEVLLHGEGTSCWPALRHAVRLGLDTRIGLEDALTLPDGSPAPDNAALVRAARALLGER